MTGDKTHVGVLPEAQSQYLSSKPSYFPGSTVSPWSAEQQQAAQMGANRATMGSPLNAAAGAETMKTLSGDYLGQGNPYLDAIRHNGLREASAVASKFGAGGRVGSGAMSDSVAAGYGSAVAPYEYGAYEAERGRMGQAAALAPQLAQQDYVDIGQLQNIGAARQSQSQDELNAEIQRHNFNETIDQQKLEQYANLVRGISSPYSSTVGTTQGPSTGQQVIGSILGLSSAAAGAAPLFPAKKFA
jgi:hypothetical protein